MLPSHGSSNNKKMEILTYPSALSLVGNMNHVVITANADVAFVLTCNGSSQPIVQHTYSPNDAGRIEVDLKNIILPLLSFRLQDISTPYQQTAIARTFTLTVTEVNTDGTTGTSQSVSFTVIRAGVDGLTGDPSDFLTQNFLTWQPNVKPVTYYSPEFLTYYATERVTIPCKAYFEDGSTRQFSLAEIAAGQCWTIPVQYAIIAGKCSLFPQYYDVWVENASGQRLTYIQRYVASDMRSEEEQWVLFENSLGGIDCFRAYGDSENTAEHTHNVAEIEEDFEEYRVDTTRKFQKNTGHLGKKERLWLLDFFPSLAKYVYVNSHIRRIVVIDSDVSYNAKELPSTYNFTYKYADARPYLNLPRAELPQAVMNISVPQLGSFTIAPRLVEFPRLQLSGGALFPVQNPYSETWTVTTAAAILEHLIRTMQNDYAGGGGIGHTHTNISLLDGLYLLEEYLTVYGKKIKAGYADVAKTLSDDSPVYKKFIRKDRSDSTPYSLGVGGALEVGQTADVKGNATVDGSLKVGMTTKTRDLEVSRKATAEELLVNGDSVFAGTMSSPLFRSGFLDGYGWSLFRSVVQNALGVNEDKYTLEIDNLVVRQSMRVFEMIISQLLGENDNRVFTAMMEVDHFDAASGKVYFDNKDGQLYNPFRQHDYIMVQQFNPAAVPGASPSGYVIKQYELLIAAVGSGYENGKRVDWVTFYNFTSSSNATAAELIAKGDTFTRVDNAVDEERKGIVTITTVGPKTPYIDIIHGLKTDPLHAMKGRIGNLEGLHTPQFGWLKGFGEYLNNLYAVGQFKMATTGENVSARIEANAQRLSSTYSETVYNVREEDNFLQNGMFTHGLEGWGVCDIEDFTAIDNSLSSEEQQGNLVTVSDGSTIAPLFINGGTIGQKHKRHAVAESFDGTAVLHLYEVGISQLWSLIRANGTHNEATPVLGEENQYTATPVANTLFFGIRFLAKTSGVLALHFVDDTLHREDVVTWNITASDEWQVREIDDSSSHWYYKPTEQGRLIITYSGEIILRLVTLADSPLESYKQTVATQFIQTSGSIQLLGQNINSLSGRVTNLGIELNALDEELRLYVDTVTDDMEQRIGLRISALDSSITLYAQNLANNYYDKSAIDVKIGEINTVVAGIQADILSDEQVMEQIRQLAIQAAYAEEYTQATNPWNSWEAGTQVRHLGAIWHYVLQPEETQVSPTILLIDGTSSPVTVGSTYRYVGYDGANRWECIDNIAASTSYILQTKDYISTVVANFDENGNVTAASGIVTTALGSTLYASISRVQTLEGDVEDLESSLTVQINQISALVTGIQSDIEDQQDVIDRIQELAIDAAAAEVYNQAANPWNSWDAGTQSKHVGAVWHNTTDGKTYRYIGYDNTNTWECLDNIAASTSYVLQTKDYISAVIGNFDAQGHVLAASGIVTTAMGNTLYASKEVPSANLLLGSGTGVGWQLVQAFESAEYSFEEANRQFTVVNYFPIGATSAGGYYANLWSQVMRLQSGQKYVLSFNVMKGSNVTLHLQFMYGASADSLSFDSSQSVPFANAIDNLEQAIENGVVTSLADAMSQKRPVRISEYDDGSYYRYFYVFTAQNTFMRLVLTSQIPSTEVTSSTVTDTTYETGTISQTTTETTTDSLNNGRTKVTTVVSRSQEGEDNIKVVTEITTQTAKPGYVWLRRLQIEKAVNTNVNDIRPSEYKEEQTMIESYIKQTADSITLSADRIDFIGKTVINGKFVVDMEGNVTMNNLTANNATIKGNFYTPALTITSSNFSQYHTASGDDFILNLENSGLSLIYSHWSSGNGFLRLPIGSQYEGAEVRIVNAINAILSIAGISVRDSSTSGAFAQWAEVKTNLNMADLIILRHAYIGGAYRWISMGLERNYI